ncbi:MAG: hypothetical protein BMS9Abin36_0790 [Gammaproteobacteria bacterium]|nr:MAG: hypothetical protein BMS9Abin36_0790 [Gammaproteobacteria bacterium]
MSTKKAFEAIKKAFDTASRFMESARTNVLKQRYANDSNPLYAWRAYKDCRKRNQPIPEWVLKYLDSSADELLSIKKPEKDKVARRVAEAISMNGIVFSNYQKHEERVEIALRVFELIEENKNPDGSYPKDAIYTEVAKEFKVSKTKVSKAMDLYK